MNTDSFIFYVKRMITTKKLQKWLEKDLTLQTMM